MPDVAVQSNAAMQNQATLSALFVIAAKPAHLQSKSPAVYILVYITKGLIMSEIAKIFTNGRSQAVRLPAAYRFDSKEVFIRHDAETGDVILSRRPSTWDGFFAALKGADVPADFLGLNERKQPVQTRDPFEDHNE
jgi:antitoxin VapB